MQYSLWQALFVLAFGIWDLVTAAQRLMKADNKKISTISFLVLGILFTVGGLVLLIGSLVSLIRR